MALSVLWLRGGRGGLGRRAHAAIWRRTAAGAPGSHRAGRAGADRAGRDCRPSSSAPGCRKRSSASPGWGCENLATVPAQPRPAPAPPRPQGAPPPAPPAPAHCPGPAPGRAPPRLPRSPAPRRGPAPQAPAGSALPPGALRPTAAQGPACLVPWATVSRETGPRPRHRHRYGAHLCARLRGPSAPCRTSRPAQGRALSAWGDRGSRGVGAGGAWRVLGADWTPLGRPGQGAALWCGLLRAPLA